MITFRRLQGVVLDKAFLTPCPNPDAVFASLRNQIDSWYASVSCVVGNQYSETLFELFLNILLVTLYRPSRLYLQTRPARLPLLRAAACRGVVLYHSLRRQDRLPPNYVHLNIIVTMGVSLLYAIGEYEGDPDNLEIDSWRAKCLVDIKSCESILNAICEGWPGIHRFRAGFATLAGRMRARLERPVAYSTDPSPSAPITASSSTAVPQEAAPMADAGFDPDSWVWGDLANPEPSLDLQQAFSSSDMDAVMASFGFSTGPLADFTAQPSLG